MNSTNNLNDSNCNYTEHNSSEEFYTDFSFWIENVVQSTIGVVGIAANTIAIPALCSREMFSIFNCLLMFLAIFDNFFIVCQLLEAHRRITNGNNYDEDAFNQAHEYAFAYFLYPFLIPYTFCFICVGLLNVYDRRTCSGEVPSHLETNWIPQQDNRCKSMGKGRPILCFTRNNILHAD